VDVTFLTPLAGLVALLVALPLAAMFFTERRVSDVRKALRLPEPRASKPLAAIALLVLAGLLGLGAAQPAVDTTEDRLARADAEIYVVIDTSRSMLAASAAGEKTRFERARTAALRLREDLPEIPMGLVSLTDRVLPHLLASVNQTAFESTVERAMAVDRPPPLQRANRVASTFDALRAVPTRNFFAPEATKRLVIFLTDGESRVFNLRRMRASFRTRQTGLVVVRFWQQGERVFRPDGAPEPLYEANPASAESVRSLARATGGRAFDESALDEAVSSAREFVGKGETRPLGEDASRTTLAPYLFLGAFVPLGFLLWRRNF
jgi:von Willebrand factor type A domain